MQKNNIRIVVQAEFEPAIDFAKRLENTCYDLSIEYELYIPPIVCLTAASNGRQTATLQFLTFLDERRK